MSVILIVAILLLLAAALALSSKLFPRPPDSSRYNQEDPTSVQGGLLAASVICGVLVLATALIFLASYFSSIGEKSSMEAFYRDTVGTYEHTILATGEVEISAAQPGLIDVAYLGQAEVVGERIVELRDEIANYNRRLRWFRTFNDLFIADGFLVDLPEDMKPIHLTDLDLVPEIAEEGEQEE